MKLLDMPEWKASDLIANDIAAMAEMVKAVKQVFAVGCFWISTKNVNPSEVIGGTWKSIGTGRCLITPGFGYVDSVSYDRGGQSGGSSRHRHKTANGADGQNFYSLMGDGYVPIYGSEVVGDANGVKSAKTGDLVRTTVRIAYTDWEGNLPPFYTAYMWERVG